jgi:uncharacterized Zn-finger protein
MGSYPKFQNEIGVPMVRIGCHEFECIGDKPPQDHPHIYLNMGDANEIVCPFCSTLFRFDPILSAREAAMNPPAAATSTETVLSKPSWGGGYSNSRRVPANRLQANTQNLIAVSGSAIK